MSSSDTPLPAYDLYGETRAFPDICTASASSTAPTAARLADRAAPPRRPPPVLPTSATRRPAPRTGRHLRDRPLLRAVGAAVTWSMPSRFPRGQRRPRAERATGHAARPVRRAAELADAFLPWRWSARPTRRWGRPSAGSGTNCWAMRRCARRCCAPPSSRSPPPILRSAPARRGRPGPPGPAAPTCGASNGWCRRTPAPAQRRRVARTPRLTPKHLGRITALHDRASTGRFVEDAADAGGTATAGLYAPAGCRGRLRLGYATRRISRGLPAGTRALSPTQYRRAGEPRISDSGARLRRAWNAAQRSPHARRGRACRRAAWCRRRPRKGSGASVCQTCRSPRPSSRCTTPRGDEPDHVRVFQKPHRRSQRHRLERHDSGSIRSIEARKSSTVRRIDGVLGRQDQRMDPHCVPHRAVRDGVSGPADDEHLLVVEPVEPQARHVRRVGHPPDHEVDAPGPQLLQQVRLRTRDDRHAACPAAPPRRQGHVGEETAGHGRQQPDADAPRRVSPPRARPASSDLIALDA